MVDPLTPNAPWIVVGLVHGADRLATIAVTPLPFRAGRRTGLTCAGPADT